MPCYIKYKYYIKCNFTGINQRTFNKINRFPEIDLNFLKISKSQNINVTLPHKYIK